MIAPYCQPASPSRSHKPTHGGYPVARRGLQAGDRVVCIDDTGWLIPDPGFEHLAPRKGELYTIRDVYSTGVSMVEGNPDHYYHAGRFLEVEAALELIRCRLAADPAPAPPEGRFSRPVHEYHGEE